MLANIVRVVAWSASFLHLHGLIKIALVAPLGDVVVSDTQLNDNRAIVIGLGENRP